MTSVSDWRMLTAQEIMMKVAAKQIVTDFTVVDIIKKHCQFKEGVVYIEAGKAPVTD